MNYSFLQISHLRWRKLFILGTVLVCDSFIHESLYSTTSKFLLRSRACTHVIDVNLTRVACYSCSRSSLHQRKGAMAGIECCNSLTLTSWHNDFHFLWNGCRSGIPLHANNDTLLPFIGAFPIEPAVLEISNT